MTIKTLIDKVSEIVGNQTKVAERLGVPPNRVTDWKTGVRPCPLEVQLALCDLASLDEHATLEHLREAARVPAPKRRHGALASLGLAVVGVAVSVAAFIGDAHAAEPELNRGNV